MTILLTKRLRLEPVNHHHYDTLREINGDARVMRYIGKGVAESPEETRKSIDRIQQRWAARGYGWWAMCTLESGRLLGMCALQHVDVLETNPLELGWRLHPAAWGQGYASEAARAVVEHAFSRNDVTGKPITRLIAVAAHENIASHRVMERIGMRRIPDEVWYDQSLTTYELLKP